MSTDISLLNQVFILRYFALSGNCLLLYDHLITFSSEIEYIWNAPWSVVKAAFLVNRYGNLVGQTVITLEEVGLFGPVTKKFCYVFCLYCTLFMIFSGETVRLAVMMRAWAVWGCSYRATVWLISLYTLYFLALMAVACFMWKYNGATEPVSGTCVADIPPIGWLWWMPTLVLDSIVLIMVWFSLRRSFMGFGGHPTSPLVQLLIRDSLVFYVASAFNNVFSMICWSLFRQDPRILLQLVLSFPILTIAGQRLVLNLRQLRARPYTSSYLSRVVNQELAAMDDEWWHSNDARLPVRPINVTFGPRAHVVRGRS